MAVNLRKSLRRLGRVVQGPKTLDELISIRSRRLGVTKNRIESGLLAKPEFTEQIDVSGYDGSCPFDQFLSSILDLNSPIDYEQFEHLSDAEINQLVLYDVISSKRQIHFENCEACQARFQAIHPSETSIFKVAGE